MLPASKGCYRAQSHVGMCTASGSYLGSVNSGRGYYAHRTRAEPKSDNQHFPVSKTQSVGDDGAKASFEALKVRALPAASWRQRQPDFPHCCSLFLACLSQTNRLEPTPHKEGTIPRETPLLLADFTPLGTEGGPAPATLPQSLLQDPPLGRNTALTSLTGQVALVKLLCLFGFVFLLCRMGITRHLSQGCCSCILALGPGFEF